jgi:hypothetical protein
MISPFKSSIQLAHFQISPVSQPFLAAETQASQAAWERTAEHWAVALGG